MSGPHQERCEGDGCLVGLGGLLVACGDAAPLLQAAEAPLHHVATLADPAVEGGRASAPAAAAGPVANLIGPFRNGVGDAPAPQPGADGLRAVSLVADDVRGAGPGPARPGPLLGTRMASITDVNWVRSLVFPPVTVKASGRPAASHARWTLLVGPPLDRPRAGLRSPHFGPRRHAGGHGRRWSRPTPATQCPRPRPPGPVQPAASGRTCRPEPTGGNGCAVSPRTLTAPARPARPPRTGTSTRSR